MRKNCMLSIILIITLLTMLMLVHTMHATGYEICDNGIDDNGNGETDESDCIPESMSDYVNRIYSECQSNCSFTPECEYLDICNYTHNHYCAWPGEIGQTYTITFDDGTTTTVSDCENDCTDGHDDDGDGLIDCSDPDCMGRECDWCVLYDDETRIYYDDGGIGPGLGVVYADGRRVESRVETRICTAPGQRNNSEKGHCDDNFDNDGDAYNQLYYKEIGTGYIMIYPQSAPVDCVDSDCYLDPICCGDHVCRPHEQCPADCVNETWCHDGVDNDGDHLIDCDDPDCNSYFLCQGIHFECPTGNCSVDMIHEIEQGNLFPFSPAINSMLMDWKLVSVILIMLALVIIALIYMAGTTFQNPQLIAFAKHELGQVIVSAIFLAIIIGVLLLLEVVSSYVGEQVFGSEFVFTSNMSKHFTIAHIYIENVKDVGVTKSIELLKENVKLGKQMTHRKGWSLQTYPYISYSQAPDAGYRMKYERNNQIMQAYSGMISALSVQDAVLRGFAWVIGPLLIMLGIIFRSFSFTRKIGGMLLAAGLGLFFVYPLTYSLALFTLATTIYGNSHAMPPPTDCPSECLMELPIAYNGSTKYYQEDLLNLTPSGHFWNDPEAKEHMKDLGLKFCDDNITEGGCCHNDMCNDTQSCPRECRNKPLMGNQCGCPFEGCGNCPDECKIVRNMSACTDRQTKFVEDYCPQTLCPDECKKDITDAINGNESGCGNCPWMCRWQDDSTTGWNISTDPICKNYASDCIGCDAKYKMPNTNVIEKQCEDNCTCPHYDRILHGDHPLPGHTRTNCGSCPDDCKYDMRFDQWHFTCEDACTYINETTDEEVVCPDECRFDEQYMAPECFDNDSIIKACENCPKYCKVMEVKRTPCSACIQCNNDCTRKPAVRTDCAGSCLAYEGEFTLNPAVLVKDLSKVAADGDPDLQAAGVLMVPAYILPLFNVILTLAFIRGFSKYLGGDYEIPGIEKVI